MFWKQQLAEMRTGEEVRLCGPPEGLWLLFWERKPHHRRVLNHTTGGLSDLVYVYRISLADGWRKEGVSKGTAAITQLLQMVGARWWKGERWSRSDSLCVENVWSDDWQLFYPVSACQATCLCELGYILFYPCGFCKEASTTPISWRRKLRPRETWDRFAALGAGIRLWPRVWPSVLSSFYRNRLPPLRSLQRNLRLLEFLIASARILLNFP